MKNVLENHLARKLLLIEELYNKKKYLQLDEAAELLCCSKNTLSKDIMEINKKFYVIEYEKTKGLSFNKNKGVNFNYLYGYLLTESTSVQLLKQIIIEEPTITDIAYDIFISESKVRKLIGKWNEYLKGRNFSFKIIIDKNKLILAGNETDIRLFCHYMFFGLNYTDIYDQTTSDSQLYRLYKENIKKQYSSKCNIGDYELTKAYYFMITALYRIKNGHYDNVFEDYHPFKVSFSSTLYRNLETKITQVFNVEVDTKLVNQIIHHSYFKEYNQELAPIMLEVKEKYERFVQNIIDCIPNLILTEETTRKIKESLLLILLHSPQIKYFLVDHNINVYNVHFKQYRNFFMIINDLAEQEGNIFKSEEIRRAFFIKLVYTLNAEICIAKYTLTRPCIAIYSFGTADVKKALKSLMQMFFGERIGILITDNLEGKTEEADLIITNYLLPTSYEDKTIYFPENVTLEWLFSLDEELKKFKYKYHGVFGYKKEQFESTEPLKWLEH